MKLFWTKEQSWLDRWDAFIFENSRGHYAQLSDWIRSYETYGFDYNFLILTQEDKIVGGCGIVIAKFSFFRFNILNCGPILMQEHENQIENFFEEIFLFSKKSKACYLQINLPLSEDLYSKNRYTLSKIPSKSLFFSGKEGVLFKYVISVNGFRWVNLEGTQPYLEAFSKYNSNTKRNVKKSLTNDLIFSIRSDAVSLKEAYSIIENNAKTQGYSVRSYESFKDYLQKLLDKKYALLACCFKENEMVGCLILFDSGKRFSYIMGGIKRDLGDFKIGHFLHDQMIHLSIQKGYLDYDISVGGSSGVLQFKKGFGSYHQTFLKTRHWVISPTTFKVFLLFEKYIRPYKKQISILLHYLKLLNKKQ